MPGRRYTDRDRLRFQRLRSDGLSIAEAAKRIGCSEATAVRWQRGDRSGDAKRGITRARDVPDPRRYDQLSDLGRAMLQDFGLFCEEVFCRRVPPWRKHAADLSVELILDRSERHYVVANEPPGVGKSTLWELDIPAWLLCGGGFLDPGFGRALRFMFGHEAKKESEKYVRRLARILASPRPYYDKEQQRYAEVVLCREYGRFRPLQALGDVELWQADQFIVAQLEDVDLAEKEPTVQAASHRSEFIGNRCDYAAWDDLVTEKNSLSVEAVDAMDNWFEKEAEQRVEPGGVLWLIGQRISPIDLFRRRLDQFWVDDDGELHQKYVHIVWPVHNEATCSGEHRQWDLADDGCLLDEVRFPWIEVLKVRNSSNYRTVFQQEDTDPTGALVLPLWIKGGVGADGEVYPGCYDDDRGFFEHPARVDRLVDYACVDPAVTSNWAIEWWATASLEGPRYLIAGERRRMGPSMLLDWDESKRTFVGVMHEWTKASIAAGHPIRVWVIEANAAQKWLFDFRHFERWQDEFRFVEVIPHQTQKNKADPVLGVDALLKSAYRLGLKRLPRKHGDLAALNYLRAKEKELTTWPRGATSDTVMADWFGEANIEDILRYGRRPLVDFEVTVALPPYLLKQRREAVYR